MPKGAHVTKGLTKGQITQKRLDREARFIDEYFIDFNGTMAAVRSGYAVRSAGVTAAKLLKNPNIQGLIAERRAELAKVAKMTQEQWVEKLEYLSRANITQLVQWDQNGEHLEVKASSEMTEQESWLISEIRQKKGKFGDSLEIKLTPKLAALVELGKALGYYPKVEKDGEGNNTYNQVNINLQRGNDPLDLSALSAQEKAAFRNLLEKMAPKVIGEGKGEKP